MLLELSAAACFGSTQLAHCAHQVKRTSILTALVPEAGKVQFSVRTAKRAAPRVLRS